MTFQKLTHGITFHDDQSCCTELVSGELANLQNHRPTFVFGCHTLVHSHGLNRLAITSTEFVELQSNCLANRWMWCDLCRCTERKVEAGCNSNVVLNHSPQQFLTTSFLRIRDFF